MKMRRLYNRVALGILSICIVTSPLGIFVSPANAQSAPDAGPFDIQLAPSPLVATLQPGQTNNLQVQIRNNGPKAETLKIELLSFTTNPKNGKVSIGDTPPPLISDWTKFSAPVFTIQPGQWFTENVSINIPKNSAFTYAFAIAVSRKSAPKIIANGSYIRASVATFTLLNINRPGANTKIDVTKFMSAKRVYEYLPSNFSVTFVNRGNTIVQPAGNIFIQRSSKDTHPIDILPVNMAKGYILPGVTRTVSSKWDNGFPVYTTVQTAANVAPKQELQWNWAKLSNLRFGRYTAKLVAVYSDGTRDVPIQAELTFWVIPWKILGVGLVILLLIIAGLWAVGKRTFLIFHHKKKHEKTNRTAP